MVNAGVGIASAATSSLEADAERAALRQQIAAQESRIAALHTELQADRRSYRDQVDRLVGTIGQLKESAKAAAFGSSGAGFGGGAETGAGGGVGSPAGSLGGVEGSIAAELAELRADLAQTRGMLLQSKTTEAELRDEIRAMEATLGAGAGAAGAVGGDSDLRSPAAAAQAAMAEEARKRAVATLESQAETHKLEMQSLEHQVSAAKAAQAELQAQLEKKNDELDRAMQRMGDMEAAAKVAARQAKSDAGNLRQFVTEADHMRRTLTAETERANNAEKQVGHLRMRVEELQREASDRAKAAEDSRRRADEAAAEAEKWRLHARQLESELAAFRGSHVVPDGTGRTSTSGFSSTEMARSPRRSPKGESGAAVVAGSPVGGNTPPGYRQMNAAEIRRRDRVGGGVGMAFLGSGDGDDGGAVSERERDAARLRELEELEAARVRRLDEEYRRRERQSAADAAAGMSLAAAPGAAPHSSRSTRGGGGDRRDRGGVDDADGIRSRPAGVVHSPPPRSMPAPGGHGGGGRGGETDAERMEREWREAALRKSREDDARQARFDAQMRAEAAERAASSPPSRPGGAGESDEVRAAREARQERLRMIAESKARNAARLEQERQVRERARREIAEEQQREEREARREANMRRQQAAIAAADDGTPSRGERGGGGTGGGYGGDGGDDRDASIKSMMRREAFADADRRRAENEAEAARLKAVGIERGSATRGAALGTPPRAARSDSAAGGDQGRAADAGDGLSAQERMIRDFKAAQDAARARQAVKEKAPSPSRGAVPGRHDAFAPSTDWLHGYSADDARGDGDGAGARGGHAGIHRDPLHHSHNEADEAYAAAHRRRRIDGVDQNRGAGVAAAWGQLGEREFPASPAPGEEVLRPGRKAVPGHEIPSGDARSREAAAPFATEASLRADTANVASLESRLMVLNMEKGDLESELARLGPNAGRTIAIRRRKAQIEARLGRIASESSGVRTQLRKLEPPA